MKNQLIVINLKTYKQGSDVVRLAKIAQDVDKNIILGVQPSDIFEIAKKTRLKVYSQHVDYFEPGRYTGYVLPEAVKKAGAVGSFLNHSEHKLKFEVLKKTIIRCKKISLKTMVFAGSLKEAKKIEKLKPDYLIYEPPELVAGKISVSEAKPALIKKISKNLKMKFLVGAGIKSSGDLKIASEMGASGIAFSSVFTKTKNPSKILRSLIKD